MAKIPLRLNSLTVVLVAAVVWLGFWAMHPSDMARMPMGDSSFYSSMTYNFFTDHRDFPVSSIHGRRLLGPFFAAILLKMEGIDSTPDLHFEYDPRRQPPEAWSAHQIEAYAAIHLAWQILNFIAFLFLAVALSSLLDATWPAPARELIFANLLLTPSLGLLMVFWPPMNDLITLAVFTWGLVFLDRGRESVALILLGLAALGREQVLMLLPLLYFFRPFHPWRALVLAGTPLLCVCLFPLFPNIVPLHDSSSSQTATSAVETYFHLLSYHWGFLWSEHGLVLPYSIALNAGATFLAAWKLGLLRTARYTALLLLCFIFMADRHMVLLALIGLVAMVPAPARQKENLREIQTPLLALLLFKIALLMAAQDAVWLQAELWYKFFSPTRHYRYFFQVLWGLTLLAGIVWWRQTRLKTLNPPPT